MSQAASAADPSRNPYRRLFALPGTLAFTIGNLVARLPMGMFSVSAVIMIAGRVARTRSPAPSPPPVCWPRPSSRPGSRAW
ncbi:hypothetical protein MBT84_26065 [Streptomyces sp. MBT84]|nr:hypothetical protein [Streptomyces sp. MBT84]